MTPPKLELLAHNQRQALVRSFVSMGVDYQRANVIVDMAVKAAEDAFTTLWRTCDLTPDPSAMCSAYEIALQLVAQSAISQHQAMRETADKFGCPRFETAVDMT